MLKVTVCIGSSCHIKGSRQVVGELQDLIEKNNLQGKVELAGTFCMADARKAFVLPSATSFSRSAPKLPKSSLPKTFCRGFEV